MRGRYSSRIGFAAVCAAVLVWSALMAAAPARAATFTSGSTGADGPFAPTCAPTPCMVTITLPPSGVFNHTTGNLPAGVTVKFTRNATNTPVTLLFTADVTIAGTIDIAGTNGAVGSSGTSFTLNAPGRGGPGGFDGGAGGNATNPGKAGEGLGPGGGRNANFSTDFACAGSSGGFGTAGLAVPGLFGSCAINGGVPYGNPQLLPLIGGSGGAGRGGDLSNTGAGGGGGGGAILIASSGTVTLAGTILAKGGNGVNAGFNIFLGGGAGGGVRLVATTFQAGGGTIDARGGGSPGGASEGGQGRVRLEAFNFTGTTTIFPDPPLAPSVGVPGVVFPTGLPTLRIASVGGVAAPPAPTGSFAAPDVTLPTTATSPVAVVVTATSVPDGTPVVLFAKPQTGALTTATTPPLSGGTASQNLAMDLAQPSVVSAQATFQIAAADVPIHVAQAAGPDDPVAHVRVAAAFGASSTVTYITRSGRELQP